jgi:hypothetical protein
MGDSVTSALTLAPPSPANRTHPLRHSHPQTGYRHATALMPSHSQISLTVNTYTHVTPLVHQERRGPRLDNQRRVDRQFDLVLDDDGSDRTGTMINRADPVGAVRGRLQVRDIGLRAEIPCA